MKQYIVRAIRKVAKSGQISIPPEIIEIMKIEPGDYIEFDVISIVRKGNGSTVTTPANK